MATRSETRKNRGLRCLRIACLLHSWVLTRRRRAPVFAPQGKKRRRESVSMSSTVISLFSLNWAWESEPRSCRKAPALGGGAGRLIAARCHELRANQSAKDPKSALRFSRSKDRCQDRNPSATSVPVMQRNPYTLSVSCFREKRVRPPEGQDSARHEKLRGGHPGA
jgi:hypothetical protein